MIVTMTLSIDKPIPNIRPSYYTMEVFYVIKFQLFLLALVLSIFNWLMTFLGSNLVHFVKSKSQKLVSSALGLAAGIMIAATFFSLLLPAIQQVEII